MIVVEAGVVTVGTNVLVPLLLGKSIDPAKVALSFGENVALAGFLRLFSVGVLAAARRLAPGRTLVQLGLIVGGTTLAGALPVGYELIKNRIETGRWSTQLSMFMGANVVLTLGVFAFTGGKVHNALVALNKTDILADLIRLRGAAEGMADKFLAAAAGRMTKPEFEELQARAARILPDFERLCRRLADFSDAELAQLGFTKAYLRDFPERLAELTEFIAALKYVPPEAGTPQLALAEAAGTSLARIGVQSFEYDSAALSAAALAARLRGAGYQPDILSGGVLRLRLPHGEQAYLLPAGAPRLTLEDVISPAGQISKDHTQLQQAYDAYLARCAAENRAPMDAHQWARYTTRGATADYLTQVLGDNWRAVRQGQYPGYHPELIERPSAAPTEGSPGAPGGVLWKENRVPIGDIRYAIDEVGEPYWTFPDLADGVVLILPSGTRVWRDPHTGVIWEEHPVSASVSSKRALTAGEAVIPSAGEMGAAQAGQQRAHGAASPGLGFDSPYSVARTPPEVNLAIENGGIELWVRGLRDNAPLGVQYLFMTGTARQAGRLTERVYKVSASSRGKIVISRHSRSPSDRMVRPNSKCSRWQQNPWPRWGCPRTSTSLKRSDRNSDSTYVPRRRSRSHGSWLRSPNVTRRWAGDLRTCMCVWPRKATLRLSSKSTERRKPSPMLRYSCRQPLRLIRVSGNSILSCETWPVESASGGDRPTRTG